ncbi:hypothetical protein CC1G_10748 [Coprinopsis cinerea okayama7|uniref:Uncharacterized protein n=1 Tax=Coprinopsis cinerea (strain Okayama-7 / 130 / ATCC MYA-4618 / FGSC 9003) TaxID=240176 RepID=A8P3A4_COPC7|nr:hypothetical protein CC1G_10748 [Coprinopsis cinerea okayama7\|eukprot:XP_001838506.2 hypothetical protein CC1G_10748 [Coprinopsis cinerea okayama7\
MASQVINQVIPGFSLTNRWLLYTSIMLTPAQALSGVGSHCPSNLGFLAFNWYQQYSWYMAAKSRELHALSLLPVHLNLVYAITYLGGITAGNAFIGVPLGLGTAGLMILNTVTAWISLKTNLPEGDGVYQFFFFGWRTLSKGWRIFFLLWQINDTLVVAASVFIGIIWGVIISFDPETIFSIQSRDFLLWRETAILWGPPTMLLFTWPLVLWMELIVQKNNIVSETDMVSVWLFIAQVATMVWPSLVNLVGAIWWCGKRKAGDEEEGAVIPMAEKSINQV